MSSNLMNAGLPQPPGQLGMPVGVNLPIPSDNFKINLADGSEWLRSGVAVPAAGYSEAAKLVHLRAHIFTRTASPAFATVVRGLATDGAGTFVAVLPADTANVYVSSDHGVTWVARAHNIAGGSTLCAVVWAGSRFVAVGSTGAVLHGATSVDGAAWASMTIIAAVTGGLSDSADVAWNGSSVVAICQGAAASCCASSPTGLPGTWTTRVMPGNLAAGSRVAGGGLGFLSTNGTSTGGYRSLDGGASWANVVLGSNALAGSRPMVGANFAAHFIGANQIGYSTDLLTFAQANVSLGGVGLQNTQLNVCSGGRWVIPTTAGIAVTVDGINWVPYIESSASPLYSIPAPSSRLACIGGGSIVQADSWVGGQQAQFAMSTLDRPNGIGGGGSSGMWRIK